MKKQKYFRIGFYLGKVCAPGEEVFAADSIENAVCQLKKQKSEVKKICYFTEVKKQDFEKTQKIKEINSYLETLNK